MPARVAIFSRQSLLAGGIAQPMAHSPEVFEVVSFDPAQAEALRDLRAFRPAIVIVDALDAQRAIPLTTLLELLPGTKVVQVDCDHDHVQVFCSEQFSARRLSDLLATLQQFSPPLVPPHLPPSVSVGGAY